MKEEKTYRLEDGSAITATTPSEFVTKLRESSMFDSECTDQEYMYQFAHRYEVQTGSLIRADNPENFLKDLQDTGYIKVNGNSL